MRKLVLLLPLLLAGCVTAEELAVQDDAKCKSYGAQPGSPGYLQCRTQLDVARTQAKAMIAASPTCSWNSHGGSCF